MQKMNHDKVLSCTFISSRLKIGVDHQLDLEMELKMELWGFVLTESLIVLSLNPYKFEINSPIDF